MCVDDDAVQACARRTVVNRVTDAHRRRSSTEPPIAEVLDLGGRAVRDHSGATADRDLLNQCAPDGREAPDPVRIGCFSVL